MTLSVLFSATLIRTALGFGEALVAVPLLAFLLPIEVAAPLAVLLSITVSVLILGKDWSEVEWTDARQLVLSTFLGIPMGLWLLTRLAEGVVKSTLAIVILLFSLHSLVNRRQTKQVLTDDRLAPIFGLIAGVLGGAYGMNGPPLVVYGTLRGWSPARFRATLQGYFLPASAVGLIGYALLGLWNTEVTWLYLCSLPAVLPAIWLGNRLHGALSGRRFVEGVHLMLVGVALMLLGQAL